VSSSTDFAAPGRLRRLILTAAGPLLLLVVTLILVALYGERLPSRVSVNDWSIDTHYEHSWRGVSSQPLWGVVVWFEVTSIVFFLRYWYVPQAQRLMVMQSSVLGLAVPVSGALWFQALVDHQVTARPGWHLAVEIAALAGALALGWVVAGRLPSAPETTAAPPAHAPAMTLGPWQRAMFVTTTWSVRRLLVAATIGAVTGWVASTGNGAWQGVVLLSVWTLFEAAHARTRLQIDWSGVTMTLPWLPALRRTVRYPQVLFAEARSEAPPGRFKLYDGGTGWGAVSGKGPVLVLSLTDERWFVFSTREAETAAALVNGWLSRQRQAESA
jgi:hypothetical protein